MNELVFFLEELSAEAMLKGLLPRLLPPGVRVRYVVFEGKQDLEKRLARHLRANCRAGAHCVVLRDQDSADCTKIKKRLLKICEDAGVETLVRIACRELESWYLADLDALRYALHKLVISRRRPAALQTKAKKDILQAQQLLSVLLADRPGDVELAFEAAQAQPKKFQQQLREGIQQLDERLQNQNLISKIIARLP